MTFWVAGAAVVGAVGGALISGNAAESAANTQAASADRASQTQKEIFERQIALQEPWRLTGMAGLGKLNDLLGLTPQQPAGGAQLLTPGPDGVFAPHPEIPQAQQPVTEQTFNAQAYLAANPDVAQFLIAHPGSATPWEHYNQHGRDEGRSLGLPTPQVAQPAQAPQQPASVNPLASIPGATPQTGSLLTNPGAGLKPFTNADFVKDPGYDFRLHAGEQGLTRAAAAQGGFGSGKYLKDAMTFNQGFASDEFGKAYARFNTDQGNQYNRTVADQTNIFNRLAAISGLGQTAANTLTTAAGNYGQQVGSNIIGAGNAQAAGQVGRANAINGAIGQGISMYQTNEMLKRFPVYGGGYPGGTFNPGPGTVGDFPISYYG